MPPKSFYCSKCETARAVMKRPQNGQNLCQNCFFEVFEEEVHQTIISEKLFSPGDIVACGASGGKDSTVLIHLMHLLNTRHNYGLQLILISIDEGIVGYRDDSLKAVVRNSEVYSLPLYIFRYEDLFGWTMDDVVKIVGLKNSCTYCGVFRRQALDRGAELKNANKIVTGHNADDSAETILMNFLRGDAPRLARSNQTALSLDGAIPRVKPLKYIYQKEIVLYAHFKSLDYFTTECTYANEAFRGHVRSLVKDLETFLPKSIHNIIHTGEHITIAQEFSLPAREQGHCTRCGYLTSQKMCRACTLLSSLEKNNPLLALGRHSDQ